MKLEVISKTVEEGSKVIDTMIDPIQSRLKNPFFGSFFISAIIYNWKPILYLIFSNSDIISKINYVSENFYGSIFQNILNYVLIPLIIGSIYCFGNYWVNELLELSNNKPISFSENRKHLRLLKKYQDRVEYAKEIRKFEDERSGYLNTQDLNNKIADLTKKNEENNNLIVDYQEKEKEYDKKIYDLSEKIQSFEKLDINKLKSLNEDLTITNQHFLEAELDLKNSRDEAIKAKEEIEKNFNSLTNSYNKLHQNYEALESKLMDMRPPHDDN